MWQFVIDIQRDIYLAFADHIKAFASGTGWSAFLSFLPMGIVFGAVHAMTPGHSKSILATYLAGSSLGMLRGLLVSLAISFTHVTMSVVIALFSLPLVSIMFGGTGAGSSPILESVSRGLLGVIGIWMLWSARFREPHSHGDREGIVVGLSAGLIPCPLTLFVMTFAISRGVPEAGVMFALVMMIGVALTLSAVALTAVFFRQQMVHLFNTRPKLISGLTKGLQAVSGAVLVAVAAHELWWR
ncbi:sulfite exporter TauE/SafE family protein [Pararhizobium sp. BT-229]|uniref:nickel/cobalt transporter n=1 Tax=Pararhizobium sp. BT-229 TaxID=2986923 RepID=UPI0021F6A6F8|nr:sulfite exporter TauE/SafE family protein [Pararhizobium sp. BT-229]MCV9960334.1 sulfite exporter TauE/SafE family protein [Pararhizobium sp. BT-229]